MRIVSLVPSVTETLRAWGIVPVACTRFCEQPDLPTVGGTKTPQVMAIAELAPDLVVLDEEENRREDYDALEAAGVPLLALAVRSLDDVDVHLGRLAAAVGASAPPPVAPGPVPPVGCRALVPIWRRPWMALGPGSYGASLLRYLGVAVVPEGPDRYPEVELGEVAGAGVDVVLVPSEPYRFRDSHLDELATVAPPVRVDGQDLFWWGARTPGALDRLGRVLADVVPSG